MSVSKWKGDLITLLIRKLGESHVSFKLEKDLLVFVTDLSKKARHHFFPFFDLLGLSFFANNALGHLQNSRTVYSEKIH